MCVYINSIHNTGYKIKTTKFLEVENDVKWEMNYSDSWQALLVK